MPDFRRGRYTLTFNDLPVRYTADGRINLSQARTLLRSASDDHFLIRKMRTLLYEVGGFYDISRTNDDFVINRVADLAARGLVTLKTVQRSTPGGGAVRREPEQAPEPVPVLEATRELAWVEFVLVGEDDQPIPGEAYELKLPDGRALKGRLDSDGAVRVDDIANPGMCEFSLLNLDSASWSEISFASTADSAPPAQDGRRITVRSGDSCSSLAFDAGLPPETVWNHPENAGLRAERDDMNVLAPGDPLFIPDKRIKRVSKLIDRRYRFRRNGVPEKLVIILKQNSKPRAGVAYTLDIGARHYNSTTGPDGRIEYYMAPNVHEARLAFENEVHKLAIGHLDPVETDHGLRARLYNLGYLANEQAPAESLRSAVEDFQRGQGLSPNGAADDATRRLLSQTHCC